MKRTTYTPGELAGLTAVGWSGCMHDSDCACSTGQQTADDDVLKLYPPGAPELLTKVGLAITTQVRVLPAGLTIDHPAARHYHVDVTYVGTRDGVQEYVVEEGGTLLSRTGGWDADWSKTRSSAECRCTYQEALEAATVHVEEVRVMGKTWAERQLPDGGGWR